MEDQDLREIGITDPGHRRKLLQAARSLPKVKALGCDGSTSLSSWLDTLGLQEYLHNFLSSGYRSLDCVKNLWELEIVNVLKITLLGHRKRIIASLAERPYEEPPVKPPRLSQIRDRYEDRQREPRLTLRPPSVATPYAPVQNWHHQPEKLIFESCGYEANYLGSMLIKELRGTESTQDACAKMRVGGAKHSQASDLSFISTAVQRSSRSTEQMRKVPTIVLSITYKGVKFIDAVNKNLTYEIILTLGQAFEVAYQLALQAQRTKHHHGPPAGLGSEIIETKSSRPVPKPRGSMRKSAGPPLVESRCCYCHTCTTHRPSYLPLHSVSPGVQMDPMELEADTQSQGSATWLVDPKDSKRTISTNHSLLLLCAFFTVTPPPTGLAPPPASVYPALFSLTALPLVHPKECPSPPFFPLFLLLSGPPCAPRPAAAATTTSFFFHSTSSSAIYQDFTPCCPPTLPPFTQQAVYSSLTPVLGHQA
ncbi:hypothetical protein JZ751_003677, partial [Albula glossodonta]